MVGSAIILAAALAVSATAKPLVYSKRQNSSDVCDTPECQLIAGQFKSNLAPNYTAYDPCTDFDRIVCGGWDMHHDYRPDQSSISAASYMDEEIDNLMKEVLETPYATNTTPAGGDPQLDRANFNMMQDAYKACMNEDLLKSIGVKPLADILEKIKEIFPIEKPASYGDDNAELTDALLFMTREYGIDSFVSAGTGSDDKNPDVVTIWMSSGSTGLPEKSYYNMTDIVANYTTAISKMFSNVLGNTTNFDDLAKKIVDLEAQLSRADLDPADAQEIEIIYNAMDLPEVDALLPEISLTKLVTSQYPPGYNGTRVIVTDPDYYKAASGILKATPRETMQGFFLWRATQAWAGRLHRDYNRPLRNFNNMLNGRDPDVIPERWRTCLGEAQGNLAWIYSEAYVQRAFSPEAKALGDRIIYDIKAIFTERLQKLDWMSTSVKQLAANKVQNLVQKIGYPTKSPNVLDPASIRSWYGNLTVSNATYFENGLGYSHWGTNKTWYDLLAPTDKDKWYMTAAEVNAYYNPTSNEIAFPAGIMQAPLFGDKFPEYVSYGAFGSIAGHELSHAFDDNGRLYDETGRLNEWWDNSTIKNFDEKAKCFVNQYDQYQITGLDGKPLNVSGRLTQGENIADSGGIAASYDAWKKRDVEKPNPLLPGLETFTKEQMFFLSYGTWWCGKAKKEVEVQWVLTDPHSPDRARILYTLANTRAFKDAFSCPVREPVCQLW